ncbi:MAG TPA: MG2 domain-containing protein [Saprospiraceae bacterium]|nr:MG2 domain-containing protein [Saprospiraceae bacterium]HPI05547.1 MG2 domain-containing protein [Saprospiraceae bacterium]
MPNLRTPSGTWMILSVLVFMSACKWLGSKEQPSPVNPSTTTMPSSNPIKGVYSDDWAVVDSLEKKGLFKSALEKVEAIEARAKAENKQPQIIKAILFRGKYITRLEEDGFVKALQVLEAEEKSARVQPEKALLQSILGQLYATFLSQQGWSITERTPIPDGEGGDILTWSAAQIEKRALELYNTSVSDEGALSAIPISDFEDVISPGQNDSIANAALRPTLYDLVAHRAIDHFMNERNYLTEPAYAFQLDQEKAFADREVFQNEVFVSQDTSSGKLMALRLFQKLLRHHASSNTGDPKARQSRQIDIDLKRLQFVFANSVREDKNALYVKALERLHESAQNHPSQSEIAYQLASFLFYSSEQDKSRNTKKAIALCEDAVRQHPGSYGENLCRQLLAQMKATSLDITVEQVSLPEKNSLVQLSFRNLTRAYLKVVRANPDNLRSIDRMSWEERLPYLLTMKEVQQREWAIPDPGDYQQHTTELALDGLPRGYYCVLVSDNPSFTVQSGHVSFAAFAVSQLAVIQANENGTPSVVVTDRLSGAPLEGVKLEFYLHYYGGSVEELRLQKTTVTNKDGWGEADNIQHGNLEVRAIYQQDTLWAGNVMNYRYNDEQEESLQTRFFTDRKLYRPGQQIYFKGVLYKNDAQGKPQIIPNHKVTVKLYDVNQQDKATVTLRSNEYGSFNGVFTAPTSGLTGLMNIRCDEASGAEFFSVEEYKRPRFEVTMKPVEGAYRVGDRITVKGEAKNYAGNVVDGAALRYRVVRQARFPFWDWGWFRKPFPPVAEMEIASGTLVTGADGGFEIPFEAIPDKSVSKKDQPVFDYRVFVDVTDVSGETRSNSTQVSAGYSALQISWNLTDRMVIDSMARVSLFATNMSGRPQEAEGMIHIVRLKEPSVFYKNRYWERPDVRTIPATDWARMFPDMAYKNEDDPEHWEIEVPLVMVEFNTAKLSVVDLQLDRMTPGYYNIMLFTKDKYGEEVVIKKTVHVIDPKKPETRFDQPNVEVEKSTLEPGEIARFWMGGKAPNLHFLLSRESNGTMASPRWYTVKGGGKTEMPVTEADRGGFAVHWFAVYNNRVYGPTYLNINVPWSNKDLQISYETFRDKLSPGQKEEWRLKISGPKKDKVAAEMVAAMYDASLDQFAPHSWERIAFPFHNVKLSLSANYFAARSGESHQSGIESYPVQGRGYPQLNWWGFPMWAAYGRDNYRRPDVYATAMPAAAPMVAGGKMRKSNVDTVVTFDPETYEEKVQIVRNDLNLTSDEAQQQAAPPAPPEQNGQPAPRRNLNETVFFFPELRTDKDGNIVLKFTMNEALTRWKLLTFAHTKSLEQAISVKEVVTQKELMVISNPPRFLRAGDSFEFAAKVSNLSQQVIQGKATLNLLDAATLKSVGAEFELTDKNNSTAFNIQPGQSAPLAWKVKIPEDFAGAVTWQIFADGNKFRDGEESSLPVVPNRMLVTETLPITVRGNQTKSFVFDNFKNGGNSNSLVTHRYTIEFTSNPVWYAVQALPYIMEYPHECSEQIFSRFYANTLATSVVSKMPQIKRVYDRWKGTDAMKSNLEKNQELKSALLEETPWVLDAQNEQQQKQNIALLFDLNRMASERERTLAILAERQLENGAWAWFPGGKDSWYITQHLVTGFGHLGKLGALDAKNDQTTAPMLDRALGYCDRKVIEQYNELERQVKAGKAKWDDDHLDGMIIQYLYARSFYKVDRPGKEVAYYLGQAEKFWLGKGIYQEGLIALALHRNGRGVANDIVKSLRERAIMKEELGMYWPVSWGYYWYQLPVETQALMVEVFGEVANDAKSVEELRIWLLKNKQTNRWESTKATAEAVYALLIGTGTQENWLNNNQPVQVSLGGKTLKPAEMEVGTGYFKEQWTGKDVKSSWSKIEVKNPNSNIVWGAAYWQYFEDLDKIKDFQKTPLTIVKQLFTEENSPTGPVLKPVKEGTVLHRGDKIKVRIEIRVDREMEFVHLKDMRAAGFEPVNVLSGYKWQGGLGYYESTKDLATNFFIDYLPRGTFVFEYPLVVSHRGDMSNGITTMQCMYAPEFTSHSKGVRVKVE